MDEFVIGKFKKIIYLNHENGYLVALFSVEETNNIKIEKGKLINVTGTLFDVKENIKYNLKGSYIIHPKYSWQFSFTDAEVIVPKGVDAIYEFLASSFVEGCGKATAKKIVDKYGEKALDIIKNDVSSLLDIKGMTNLKAMKIYNSIMKLERDNETVTYFQNLGFSMDDISKIINKHRYDMDAIIDGNLYLLKDIFEFSKIDNIFVNNFDRESPIRIKECILNGMMQISFNEGSTYYNEEEIYRALTVLFSLNINKDDFLEYLLELEQKGLIKYERGVYYLDKYYHEERLVANILYDLSNDKHYFKITKFDEKIKELEKKNKITYNDEQKRAIKESLTNSVSVISGGPGTGKTTIINAIVNLYKKEKALDEKKASVDIALLAPTGRASKKLAMATLMNASTIHRYLKWHKESDTFEYDENNKVDASLVIVDETSMIDISLMCALLKALKRNTTLVLVGDIYQLPSVGPGYVLKDIISSDLFAFTQLNIIYRQSDNSYIPFLAKDIKMQNIDEEFMYKRDDYNFIVCEEGQILPKIIASCKLALEKGINEDNMQVLAPMYKGDNGIDNLNVFLQKVYNPQDGNKNEVSYGSKIFREGDKVLELVNDSDINVFNGDIGKITSIYYNFDKKLIIEINFDGNVVHFEKKDLKNITHAYAISIHKSQGSEFEHVIMPMCNKYFVMLYNKLLYTGVSRAKKSLTIIGDPRSFITGINNNKQSERKTALLVFLKDVFKV